MEFNLKQWTEHEQQQQQQQDSEEEQPSAKIRRHHLLLESSHQQQNASAAALLLFGSSEPQNNKITSSHILSYPDHSSTSTDIPTSCTRFPRVEGGYCFSIAQWQELELQALIFRHMIAGAAVPPELLQLVKKSLLASSASPYYLHHYSLHFQQAALFQGGYWGKGAMDPEPGRCRRTDGKKWRCSRDAVAGHKYCERHVHRGRNRSRKPVEFPPASAAGGGGIVGSLNKSSAAFAAGSGGGGCGGGGPFSLSRSGAPLDAFQLNQGPSSELSHHEQHSVGGEKCNSSRVLMHFFDDWPRSLQQNDTAESNGGGNPSSTSLSISTRTSDFLRLSTGNGNEVGPRGLSGNGNGNDESERVPGWSGGGRWGGSQVGGPLGEALRSSTNSSHSHSPTSVLHQLSRCSASDTSYVTA